MNDEYDDLYVSQRKSWICPLCSAENSRGEKTCRFCRLPSRNECSRFRHTVGKNDHFCKYCGSITVYFESAVSDPQERALAKKACKQTFAYWRKHGVRYMNIEDEYEYYLLMLAQERLANNNISNAVSEADVMASLGISEDEINAAEDVEIE